jgi:hypothetical protein
MKVKIIETKTGKVVEEITVSSERSAEKVSRGVNINLNHRKYHTEIDLG